MERNEMEAVEALKKLVSFRILIAKVEKHGDVYCLVLTSNGLFEEFSCKGHDYGDIFDDS